MMMDSDNAKSRNDVTAGARNVTVRTVSAPGPSAEPTHLTAKVLVLMDVVRCGVRRGRGKGVEELLPVSGATITL